MAWTLLSAGLAEPPPTYSATAADPQAHAQGQRTPSREPAPDAPREAWILAGGLVRTLEQAGMVERFLAGGHRPGTLYGWGIGAAGAVLAALAQPAAQRRAWEDLRSSRFVIHIALRRTRCLALLARGETAGSALRKPLERASAGTRLMLHVEGRFMQIADGTLPSVLDAAMRGDTRDPSVLAVAITEAAAAGYERVLVLARHERESTRPEVAAAVADAREAGVEICFVPPVGDGAGSGLLELVLPGSGAVERLVEGGRRAAARWSEARREAATL